MSRDSSSAAALGAAGLQALMGSALPVGLALLDRELRFVAINAMLAESNGLGVDAHLGRTVREIFPLAADAVEPLLLGVLETGEARRDMRVAAEVPSLPGEASDWDASYLPVVGPDGEVIGVLVQALNLSLERQHRRLKEEGERLLRGVLDSLFVFVGLFSTEGVLLDVNKAPLEAAGITLDQVQGLPLWDTFWWADSPDRHDWLRETVRRVAGGETIRRDVEVRMAGDSPMAIDFMLTPLRDEQGQITRLVGSAIDISARLSSERALRDSDDRYRRVFEGSTLGKALVDSEGTILLVNERLSLMFGYTVQEMVGMPVHRLVPQRQREAHVGLVDDYLVAPKRRFMAERQELFALRQDGSEFPVEIALNPLREGDGRQVLATISDVTERRAAQIAIERALREKTVLLNEIHHRVKNNLQIISSLLNLQSRNAEPGVQLALRDSQSRVRSMALMHQLLYERADFSALELGPYLQRLGSLLRETYLGEGTAVRLQVELPAQGLRIDLQRAIPCGLLVTELVTNAIKHAFPSGRSGVIEVTLRLDASGEASVDVHDDGVGMQLATPERGRNTGLGFQLLPMLAEQCQGRLEQVPSATGTHFRLHLNLSQGDKDAAIA